MKGFLTLFALILAVNCYSQTPDKSKSGTLSVGLSTTILLSNLEHPLFYEVADGNFGYVVSVEDQSHSLFYQANVQYRWENKLYAVAALGFGFDNINSNIIHFEEWANVGAGGSSWATRSRSINIKESRTSIVGSLEAGINFLKPERRFQIGIGTGFDITSYVKQRVIRNEIIKTAKGNTTINNPSNPSSVSYSETTEHEYESEEWNNYVRENEWSIFSPKIVLTTSIKISDHFSFFAKAQVRFLLLSDATPSYRSSTQFPISGGILYDF